MLLTEQTSARTTDRLAELGLRPDRPNAWSGEDLHLSIDGGWLRFSTARSSTAASAGLDSPGLWKPSAVGGRVFEVPLDAILRRIDDTGLHDQIDQVDPEFDDDQGDHPEVAMIAMLSTWAVQTLDGNGRKGWAPPAVERLNELIPPAALSFRSDALLEPCTLVSLEHTLRLQVCLGRIDPALSDVRRGWVDRVVADARRLRLVRVERRGSGDAPAMIEATVDLTGAPAAIGEAMLPLAVDALRHCFEFLALTATIVGDAQCASRVLDTVTS